MKRGKEQKGSRRYENGEMNRDAASPPQSTSSWRHFGLIWPVFTSTHFSVGGQFYEQANGVASGSPLSPVIANFFMGDLEDKAWAQVTHKPLCFFRYVDTFVNCPHRTEKLERFLYHLNDLHGNIRFTVEMEKVGHLPFLDIGNTGYRMAPWVIRSTENLPTLTSTWTLDHTTIPPTCKSSFNLGAHSKGFVWRGKPPRWVGVLQDHFHRKKL
jgi:hypothetical protein